MNEATGSRHMMDTLRRERDEIRLQLYLGKA